MKFESRPPQPGAPRAQHDSACWSHVNPHLLHARVISCKTVFLGCALASADSTLARTPANNTQVCTPLESLNALSPAANCAAVSLPQRSTSDATFCGECGHIEQQIVHDSHCCQRRARAGRVGALATLRRLRQLHAVGRSIHRRRPSPHSVVMRGASSSPRLARALKLSPRR